MSAKLLDKSVGVKYGLLKPMNATACLDTGSMTTFQKYCGTGTFAGGPACIRISFFDPLSNNSSKVPCSKRNFN